MKNWLKENWHMLVAGFIALMIVAGIVTLSVLTYKWIIESDMPDWLKLWFLMG